VLVDLNDASYGALIVVEAAMPISVGQHYIGSAIDTVLIGCMEETPQVGLNSEHVKVVSAGCKACCSRGVFAGVESDKSEN